MFLHPAIHPLGHIPTLDSKDLLSGSIRRCDRRAAFLRISAKKEHFWSLAELCFKQLTCNHVLIRLGTELRGVKRLNSDTQLLLLHRLLAPAQTQMCRSFLARKAPVFVATHQFNDTSSGGFVKVTKIMCSKSLQCVRKIISEQGSA